MNTIKFDKKNVKVIAHRGVSGLERENTCASFVAAGNRSYYGIETDIHKTMDGNYIIIHDDTTGRVAIDNLEVEKSTFETLRALQLTNTDGTRSRSDLHLPTLEEYIGINKKYEKYAVLELKNAFTEAEVLEICANIEKLDYLDHVIFISFSYDNLVYLRRKYPNQAAQFLTSKYDDSLIDRLKAWNLDLDIRENALTAENVAELKAAGITINCWTVDDPARAEELVNFGVDMITTNILE
ncbi:MAG: glycerophosphodiester phosphodiesterase family protein [Eubacteriales bacterium]|nr:glycerophosphodiester phosphodiesterase family protein [Eubacteriales bacterium]MDY4897852.1 glycerophosphodiester phosphodiesterase family protein [Eubacteriales bacterium]